jgi:hypothetical protein
MKVKLHGKRVLTVEHNRRGSKSFHQWGSERPTLVRAAWEQRRQNHQVPWCEKPMFDLISNALSGACDKAQPMALRQIVEMLDANPRKLCHVGISEDLLARFDGYH